MREKSKKTEGITLIALIITIIILLILAIVSISLLTRNGIIGHASKVAEKTALEQLKEEVAVALHNRAIDKEERADKTLKESLENDISGDKTVEEVEGLADACYVTRNGQTVTAYENGDVIAGKVTTWDGKSSESPEFKEFNWYIYTPGQLKFLADFVNNGNALAEGQEELLTKAGYTPSDVTMTEETMVYLMNNLDLGARPTNGNWETAENEKRNWMPIGRGTINHTRFLGTFKGNSYSIGGIYSNYDADYIGLFGSCNVIQNLIIKNSYIKGGKCTGGVTGWGQKIENCHNKNTTVILREGDYYYVGGVVGEAYEVYNCTNTGAVFSYANGYNSVINCGGVVGYGITSVEKCANYGKITGTQINVGGIAGSIYASGMITDCVNEGSVNGPKNAGGIVGLVSKLATVSECKNDAEIKGDLEVGGIAGQTNKSSQIINCTNNGSANGNDIVGGVVGLAASVVTECSNTGNITGKGSNGTGGIVGDSFKGYGQDISLCYNSGTVTGPGQVGGISGYLGSVNADPTGKETKCYNKGKVINTKQLETTGGVVGRMSYDSNVTKCFYLLSIGVARGVGAITADGDLDKQNEGAQPTDVDLKSYEEFIAWINQQ